VNERTGRVVREVEVEFDDGITAKTIRYADGFQTALYRYGVSVGRMRYITKDKVLIFQFPGLTDGVFTQDKMKVLGGWRFTPTMEWMHVQALGFYQFHRNVKLRQQAAQDAPAGWLARVWETLVPTLGAQNGCDYLHWLDNTIFRPCCDIHDRCYVTNGCSQSSWWYRGSWSCIDCNTWAVTCFLGGGGGGNHTWHPSP
jgi:hypothetical protein